MTRIPIGHLVDGGGAVYIDLPKLIETRLLVQANSGGGKSWFVRLLAERAGEHLQTIVLDPEGELSTLREKLDMLRVAPDGEVKADPRTAALLARRLLELRVSAVLDIYELPPAKRRDFVRNFLEAMTNSPKKLWHPLAFLSDEIHQFCPEKGEGDASSTEAVINFVSLARKRGFAVAGATQRLSKFHKDAAAELKNRVFGNTVLDNDVERAAKDLGMSSKVARPLLRDLEPGEFFAFGPAFSVRGIFRFRTDQVETTHPKPGSRHTALSTPKASARVQQVLAQLADLPEEAETEIRNLAQAQRRISELQRELSKKPAVAAPAPPAREPKVDTAKLQKMAQQAGNHAVVRILRPHLVTGRRVVADISKALEQIGKSRTEFVALLALAEEVVKVGVEVDVQAHPQHAVPRPAAAPVIRRETATPSHPPSEGELSAMGRAILTAYAQHPQGLRKGQALVFADYRASGKVSTFYGLAASQGWLEPVPSSDRFTITDAGLAALGNYEPLPTGAALREHVLNSPKLSTLEKAVLRTAFEAWPEQIAKGELVSKAGYQASGKVSSAFGKFVATEWMTQPAKGFVRASDVFFED
jgi:hypothetical protein